MPIIKSAIKRVRQTQTRTRRNLITKNRYKTLIKEYVKLMNSGQSSEAQKLFPQIQKSIDMAVKKNLLHKNTAARKKSSLAKMTGKDAPKVAPKSEKKAPTKKTTEKTTPKTDKE